MYLYSKSNTNFQIPTFSFWFYIFSIFNSIMLKKSGYLPTIMLCTYTKNDFKWIDFCSVSLYYKSIFKLQQNNLNCYSQSKYRPKFVIKIMFIKKLCLYIFFDILVTV